MGVLHVHLFGKFTVQDNSKVVPGLDARRVQELFSYIALQNGRPHARETIASLLWGESSSSQSKKYLRQALWQLQTSLDNHLPENALPILLVDSEWIQINPQANLQIDTLIFEQAFTVTQGVQGRDLSAGQLDALNQAITLYRSDLLEGWYQDWCLYQRERLQNMYLAMLDKLMGYCEAYHLYEEGIVYGSAILSVDRARERSHRRLMRLHYLARDRTAALRQYNRCVTALREELGVKPAHSTITLYEQIKADELPPDSAPDTQHPGTPPSTKFPLTNTLQRLKHVQSFLRTIQNQLNQEIQSVEHQLNNRK